MHLGLENVIVDTVQEHINRGRCTRSKGSPLPEIVFCVQAEVYHDDRCHTDNNSQNCIDTEQKSVYVVELVVPERGQDVVELNENRTETQKSCQRNQARGGKRKKTPVSISNIHEVHMTTLTRDVRESPEFSQPSDEKSNRKFGVSHREPPEETPPVDDRVHISSTEGEFVPELEEKTSLRYRASIDELSFVEEHKPEQDDAALSFKEEMECAALSEACLQSRQISDIEKTPQDGFAEVAKGTLHVSALSLNKKIGSNKKSRQDAITWLSLPSLGQQRVKANAFKTEIDYGSQQEEEIDDKSVDRIQCTDIEQPAVDREMVQSEEWIAIESTPAWVAPVDREMVQSEESIATESTPSWVAPWILPISPKFNKTQLISRIQSKVKASASTTLHTNLRSEVQLATAPQEDTTSRKRAAYNLREIAVMVHVLLTISGGAVAVGFFR